jgi:type I restriction enzyme S subunit
MKDSGIEWIGEIPEHWTVKKIKYLGTFRNGLTYSPDNVTNEESGTLVLRSSNIQNGNVVFDDNVYVDMDIPEILQVAAGDILICSRNGSRELIGKNAIIPENVKASFGAFMMIFRCGDPKYLYYILNSNVFSYYLGTFLTSTVNQLTAANFGNMKVVYCDSAEEREEIVAHLDQKCEELDAAISTNEATIQKLKEYRQSIIYEAVTGKIAI